MANRGTRLECGKCGEIVTVEGPGEIPDCACGSRSWRTVFEGDGPRIPYVLSRRDKLLLKALRIDPEEDIGEFR